MRAFCKTERKGRGERQRECASERGKKHVMERERKRDKDIQRWQRKKDIEEGGEGKRKRIETETKCDRDQSNRECDKLRQRRK